MPYNTVVVSMSTQAPLSSLPDHSAAIREELLASADRLVKSYTFSNWDWDNPPVYLSIGCAVNSHHGYPVIPDNEEVLGGLRVVTDRRNPRGMSLLDSDRTTLKSITL